MFDRRNKKSIMHFRCHAVGSELKPGVLGSSLKNSTDNLCGSSEEEREEIEKAEAEGLSKENQNFLYRRV